MASSCPQERGGWLPVQGEPSLSLVLPLGLFLAPRPRLKAGYKYQSPACSLAVCGHVSVGWGRSAPTSPQLQSRVGAWAHFPTQKKVPVHLCNKYSQAPTSVCCVPCRQEPISQLGLPERACS